MKAITFTLDSDTDALPILNPLFRLHFSSFCPLQDAWDEFGFMCPSKISDRELQVFPGR